MTDLVRAAQRALQERNAVTPISDAEHLPTAERLGAAQVSGAQASVATPRAAVALWPWPAVALTMGPVLAGDLVVIGALMGNGKSAVMMSWLNALAEAGTRALYLPLEVDPEQCRLRWASWQLGLDTRAVIRGDWASIGGRQAQEAVQLVLDEQVTRYPHIQIAPPKRVTMDKLVDWCRWAQREYDARVVMIDHLHRMEPGQGRDHRVSVTDMMRRIKDMARDLGLGVLAAAQLNRSSEPLDPFIAPTLARLKESAAIAEEADQVVMLSRALRRDIPHDYASQLRMGQISERDLAEHGTMVLTCRKHRLDDMALNCRMVLRVENGRVVAMPEHNNNQTGFGGRIHEVYGGK